MNRPLRIAMYVAPPIFGGVAAWARNYTRHLDHTRLVIDFIVQETIPPDIQAEIEAFGGAIKRIPKLKLLPLFLFGAWKVFRSGRYDIVHANHNLLNVFILFPAWLAGVPVRISHAHSSSNPQDGKRHLAKLLLRPFARLFATRFLACSRVAGEFQFGHRSVESGEVTIIHNAIEAERFRFDPSARDAIRKEFGLEGCFVVGHIGRLGAPKNQRFLLEMFAKVADSCENARLLIVGDGPDRERLEALVQKLELSRRVVFAGVRMDTSRFYSAFDVFCLTSFYEGLSVVLIEAQANDLPCLVSTGIPEEANITGRLRYLPLSTSDWVDAVLKRPSRVKCAYPPAYDINEAAETLLKVYVG